MSFCIKHFINTYHTSGIGVSLFDICQTCHLKKGVT